MSSKGISLAEVLLSLGLCATILLTSVDLGIVALRSNDKGTDNTTGSGLAEETLESFIYGLPPAGAPFWSAATFPTPYQADNVTLGTVIFQREIDVLPLQNVAAGLREVKVKISWKNGETGRVGSGVLTSEASQLVNSP